MGRTEGQTSKLYIQKKLKKGKMLIKAFEHKNIVSRRNPQA
jgi:hypothetical protein